MNIGTIDENVINKLRAANIPNNMALVLAILLEGKGKTANDLRQITGMTATDCYDLISDLRARGYIDNFSINTGEAICPTNVYFLKSTKDELLKHLCKQVSDSRYLENDDQLFVFVFYLLSQQADMVNKRLAIDDLSMDTKHAQRILNKLKRRGWVDEVIPLKYPKGNGPFLRLNVSIDSIAGYYQMESEKR